MLTLEHIELVHFYSLCECLLLLSFPFRFDLTSFEISIPGKDKKIITNLMFNKIFSLRRGRLSIFIHCTNYGFKLLPHKVHKSTLSGYFSFHSIGKSNCIFIFSFCHRWKIPYITDYSPRSHHQVNIS